MKNDLLLKLIHAIAEKAGDDKFKVDFDMTGVNPSFTVIEVTEREHPATHERITELVFDYDMTEKEAQLTADLMNLGIGVYDDEIRYERDLLPFIHALIEE